MLLGLMSAATAIVVTGQIDPISISYGRALPAFLPVLLPLAMMLLPLTDMMLAVVRRVSAGKSPFHPDRMHIHHRLLSAGLTHRRVVLVMYMWTAAVVFPLAAWAFIETRQAILTLGLSLIAAFVFTGFMRKTKEPAKKSAKKTVKKPKKKPAPKQDLPDSVHPTKLPDKTDATPVVRVRSASTPVVDSSSLSAASSATASVPVVDSSAEAGSAAPAGSAEVGSVAPAGSAASSATTAPRTRRSRLKPRSTTPPWLQSDESAPSSAPSTASAASTAALDAASSAALDAPSSLSAPSTFSAPSTQSAPYFATNSPDEAVAVNPAAPLPPVTPLAAQTQVTQTPAVQAPVVQAVQQPVPAPAPEQAQPALGQPAPHSPLSTPVVPATQVGQTQGAEPAVQTRRRRAGRHAATPVEQPLTPAAPTAMQPAAAAPSSLQSNQGATPANNNPVWQAPRNPNVRYDVVPNQSLWEDEEDDDTNPTGVPAI